MVNSADEETFINTSRIRDFGGYLEQTEKNKVHQFDVGKWVSQENDKQKCNSIYNNSPKCTESAKLKTRRGALGKVMSISVHQNNQRFEQKKNPALLQGQTTTISQLLGEH